MVNPRSGVYSHSTNRARYRSSVMKKIVVLVLLVLFSALATQGQTGYQKPPKSVLDILNEPAFPQVLVSPAKEHILLIENVRHPLISELAKPMLRLAGLRINPTSNGPHRSQQATSLTLMNVSDGTSTNVVLPPKPSVGIPVWSADGKYIAFTNTTAKGIELWLADTATGKSRRIPGVNVNAAYG